MTDERPDVFDRDPAEIRPEDMTPEDLAAAGLRWRTAAEHMAWRAFSDNFSDVASANRDSVRVVPLFQQRLASAVQTLQDLQHELRTKTRQIRQPSGQVLEVPSPFFADGQGRDVAYWRAQAAEAKAELARMVKAGPPSDEAALGELCRVRLAEVSAINTADSVAFNEVLLRRAVGEARDNVRTRQAELADLTRRTAPYMDC